MASHAALDLPTNVSVAMDIRGFVVKLWGQNNRVVAQVLDSPRKALSIGYHIFIYIWGKLISGNKITAS